jgi:hypothetical protein
MRFKAQIWDQYWHYADAYVHWQRQKQTDSSAVPWMRDFTEEQFLRILNALTWLMVYTYPDNAYVIVPTQPTQEEIKEVADCFHWTADVLKESSQHHPDKEVATYMKKQSAKNRQTAHYLLQAVTRFHCFTSIVEERRSCLTLKKKKRGRIS